MAKIKLVCDNCKIEFWKERGEYNRSVRRGQTHIYCSRKCGGNNPENLVRIVQYRRLHPENLKVGSEKDEYSAFRPHLNRLKRRAKNYDVTLDDLKERWEKQRGKCAYTGVKLERCFYDGKNGRGNPVYRASLDRIDSERGYTKDNIQWVSVAANLAKWKMTDKQMKEFVRVIKKS